MNDESLPWFWALSAPLRSKVRPASGSSIPAIGNGSPVSGSMPPPGVVIVGAEEVLDRVTLRVARSRQRQAAGLDRRVGTLHCWFSNGS